jgi:hypothetical protein
MANLDDIYGALMRIGDELERAHKRRAFHLPNGMVLNLTLIHHATWQPEGLDVSLDYRTLRFKGATADMLAEALGMLAKREVYPQLEDFFEEPPTTKGA